MLLFIMNMLCVFFSFMFFSTYVVLLCFYNLDCQWLRIIKEPLPLGSSRVILHWDSIIKTLWLWWSLSILPYKADFVKVFLIIVFNIFMHEVLKSYNYNFLRKIYNLPMQCNILSKDLSFPRWRFRNRFPKWWWKLRYDY